MPKRVILSPGQGAQKAGMGKDLHDAVPAARAVYDRANAALDFDLAALCFNGPQAELDDTAVCQAAVLVTSLAAFEALKATRGPDAVRADAAAGLSLGEYTALTCAGSLAFEDAVRLVRRRGLFMKEAAVLNPGAMTSVLGLDREAVQRLVDECRSAGVLVAANFNSPGQIVLSGSVPAIEAAESLAKSRGARRAIRLPVSGAFHSPLMQAAAEKLAAELARTPVAAPQIPVVSNVTARYVTSADEVRTLLSRQLTSPVLWEDSMRFLVAEGMTEAIEIGPGRVLTGLLGRIEPAVATKNVGSLADLKSA